MPDHAYRVRLDETGRLEWVETNPEGKNIHDVEPLTSVFERVAIAMISVLHIDWLL